MLSRPKSSIRRYHIKFRWNEANNVYDFAINNPVAFRDAVNSVGDAAYTPSFQYCGGNDGIVSSQELTVCAAEIAEYVGMSDASQNYIYNFAVQYWDIVDTDANGALDFDEYKLAIGALAATNARVVIAAYDNNGDGQLAGPELTTWKNQAIQAFGNWGWSVDGNTYAALQAAYANAQIDGDFNTCSMLEIARFQLNAGNVFLQ